MDNSTEEEETLPSPSLELENNSTAMVRVDPHEEPQDTELQCVLQSASEVDESQPGGVGGEPQPPEPQPAVYGGEDLLDNVRDSVDEFSESQLVGGYNGSGLSPLPLFAVEGALSGGREEKKQDVDSRYDSPPSPLPVLMPDVGKDEAEDVLDGEKRAEVDGRKDVIDGEGIQGSKSKTEAGAETEKEADALEAVKMVVADAAQETKVDDSKAAEEVQERAILEEKGVGDATEEMGLPPEEKRVGDVTEEMGMPPEEKRVGDVTEEMGMPPEEKKLADFAEERKIPALEKEIADIEVERESLRAKEVADVGEETGIAGKLDIADVKEEKEIAEETKMADVVEEVEVEMEEDTKMAHVAEDQEMGTEVADMEEEVQPAEETEMADQAEGVETQGTVEMADWAEGVVSQGETGMAVEAERVKVPEETAMAGIMDRMKTADGKDGLEKETEAPEMADVAEGMETAEEMEGAEEEEARKSFGGKRKRGRIAKVPAARGPGRKKVEEDVCFICFDGGDLVLCDRRGCPKAYHPTCVGRDEAFFRAKGKWNCGWHLCSKCEKNAHYMCYTCTFSLCKGCIKDAVILCVRGNKGLCETCMETVRLIERNEQEKKETAQVDFDDKSSWEYLFKDYWIDLKERLSITPEELAQAKNPWKGSDLPAYKQESPDDFYDTNNDGGSGSESSSRNVEQIVSKRRKTRRRLKADIRGGDSPSRGTTVATKGASVGENVEWASKELLEVIVHMRNGDRSFLPQSEVHNLLLEYIKRYNLRDPRRKSQVICDSRLQNLFGKPHVGHFEMLNLLDSHFLVKEDSQADDLQESVVDTEANNLEADENSDALIKAGKDKRRKRKKGDDRGRQSNLDDYAAINMHNINLIYLRRNLVEDLLEDAETFQSKVIGAFVRIRISGSAQKQDLYRLVQVVGTNKVAEPYKVGKRTTDILLEILNLNKTEVISIDIISNQEFTEDECKRLRQSIKCGLINRLTVGDIQEKAMALQEVRVKDWLEAEIVRLSHLRDRASEKGRRKELRECVEKLQLLKSPEERRRRLEEIPEIHADPNMDPSYESEEDEGETDDKKQDFYLRPRGSGLSRRGREPISPHRGGFGSTASWSGTRNYSNINRELSRTISSKGLGNKGDDANGSGEIVNENLWSLGRDKETQKPINWEKPKTASISESGAGSTHSVVISESSSRVVSEISPASAVVATQTASQINETEKIWHYQDPSGKVQGPFSMVQLRKWSNTGYFPAELRIWRAKEKQDESILLTDALAGKFQKISIVENSFMNAQMALQSGRPHGSPLQQGMEGQVGERSKFDQNHAAWNPKDTLVSSNQSVGESWKSQPEIGSSAGGPASSSLEIPKHSQDTWASDTNLPSPTPNRTATLIDGQVFENKWSPTSVQSSVSLSAASQFPGGTAGPKPSAGVIPESAQLLHSSTPPSSLIITAGIDGPNLSHSVSPAPKRDIAMLLSSTTGPQIHSQSVVTGESNRLQVTAHLLPPLDSVGASVNLSGSVPMPEMTAPSPKPGSGSQAWGSVSQKLDSGNSISLPAQPPAYSVWGDASSSGQHAASSFGAGNPGGIFPAQTQPGFPSSDAWKLPVPSQSNVQAPAPPNLPWGMGIADNKSTVPRQGPDNQNGSWGPVPGNQNMGWLGHLPANMNWGSSGPGPAQGNTNLGWVAAGQGQAHGSPNPGWAMAGQGQPPGNAMPGWIPPAQGPAPVNTNPGWVASNQGPVPGNVNPGWAAPPSGNQGAWGNEPSHNGDRFSNRERGSQGGDPGYGGAKPWNRQSSFGSNSGGGGVGGSARPPFKGQRVCKYHENGHCKKGAQCDYLHT